MDAGALPGVDEACRAAIDIGHVGQGEGDAWRVVQREVRDGAAQELDGEDLERAARVDGGGLDVDDCGEPSVPGGRSAAISGFLHRPGASRRTRVRWLGATRPLAGLLGMRRAVRRD